MAIQHKLKGLHNNHKVVNMMNGQLCLGNNWPGPRPGCKHGRDLDPDGPLAESWRVPAGARPAIRGDLSSFSENVTGARPGSVGIPHGTRPGPVKCKRYRAGTARASAGFCRASQGSRQGYICQDSSLVAWLTESPGVPGSSPSAADIFSWCTHMP